MDNVPTLSELNIWSLLRFSDEICFLSINVLDLESILIGFQLSAASSFIQTADVVKTVSMW